MDGIIISTNHSVLGALDRRQIWRALIDEAFTSVWSLCRAIVFTCNFYQGDVTIVLYHILILMPTTWRMRQVIREAGSNRQAIPAVTQEIWIIPGGSPWTGTALYSSLFTDFRYTVYFINHLLMLIYYYMCFYLYNIFLVVEFTVTR